MGEESEVFLPLTEIYSSKKKAGFPLSIFLITDGEVDSPQAVIELIKKNAENARCYLFGIGSGVS